MQKSCSAPLIQTTLNNVGTEKNQFWQPVYKNNLMKGSWLLEKHKNLRFEISFLKAPFITFAIQKISKNGKRRY